MTSTVAKQRAILFVDTELGGPRPLADPLLAIGTALVIVSDGAVAEKKRFCFQETMDCPIHESSMKGFWSKHLDILRTIRSEAKEGKEAMKEFLDYKTSLEKKYNLLIASDWSGDFTWLTVNLYKFGGFRPVDYRYDGTLMDTIDVQSLLMQRLPKWDRHNFSIEAAVKELKLDVKGNHTHLPDDDAEHTAGIYLALLKK
jgi:hypothetical protein